MEGRKSKNLRVYICLSALLSLLGFSLIFLSESLFPLLIWIFLDTCLAGQLTRRFFKVLVLTLPLAIILFLLTAITEREGKLIFFNLLGEDGVVRAGILSLRLILFALFSHVSLYRFGLAIQVIILSFILSPLKSLTGGKMIAARCVLRSLFLVPKKYYQILNRFKLLPKRDLGFKLNLTRPSGKLLIPRNALSFFLGLGLLILTIFRR